MKRLFSKIFLMLSVIAITAGFASCSNDDDPGDGSVKGGKMTGWVEIDGKKYDLKYCYDVIEYIGGSESSAEIVASSIDLDDKNAYKKKGHLAEFTVEVNADGSLMYDLEFTPDINMFVDTEYSGYFTDNYSAKGDEVIFEKDGDKIKFSCDDATFTYINASGTKEKTVKGKFHFEGKPRVFKNLIVE